MALRFLSAVHKASRRIGIHLDPLCAELGIRSREGHLLSYLRAYAPCSINRLHQVFGYRRSSLTSLLDRLEADDRIRRSPDSEDRRSVVVTTTARGRRLAERLDTRLRAFEADIATHVTEADVRGFEAVMDAIGRVTDVPLLAKEDS